MNKLLIKLFSIVWRKSLVGRTVIKVKGFRTALVESNMTSRQTIKFMKNRKW